VRRALRPDFQTAATGCTTSGFGFHSVCVLPSLLKILSRTDEFKNMGTDNCTGTEADLLIIRRAREVGRVKGVGPFLQGAAASFLGITWLRGKPQKKGTF